MIALQFPPVSKMQLDDIIFEINERIDALKLIKEVQDKFDPRILQHFNFEYIPVEFMIVRKTPFRDEYGTATLIDIEYGQVFLQQFRIAYDPQTGRPHSFAHSYLIKLRQLCKEWNAFEWSEENVQAHADAYPGY